MRHTISALLCSAVLATGCGAAKSAMGILSPKTPPVTVNNNINVEPAPGAQTVVVINKEQPRKKSLMEKIGIVTTSTVVGAGIGALAGNALDDAASGALLGAGVGAVAGVAIAKD